jgi:Bacterial Ig domain
MTLTTNRFRALRLTFAIAALAFALFGMASTAAAANPQFGTKDQSFSGASTAPSGSKPESKLWFNDGRWWAVMWDTASPSFRIFRADAAATTWVNTGTAVDSRGSARSDALWDGTHLYIASHSVASDSSHNVAARPAKLYRYSYSSGTMTYTLDSGFPVNIIDVSTETFVIDKDSTGKLWATWTQGRRPYVAHTTVDDKTWTAGFIPPVSGVSLNSDDISSLVPFGGNKIGVMWSNQSDSHMYFATHTDGDADGTWTASEQATTGSGSADDHINLKTDSAGRIYAAVKTSFTSSSQTLIQLLVRGSGGGWSAYRFGTVSDSHTRPIVLLDEQHGLLHMFATGKYPGASSGQSGGTIYEKTATIGAIAFSTGSGTPFIQDPNSSNMNNATSTKQGVNSNTGLVVLATNDSTKFYWHATESLGTPTNTTPTANPTSKTTAFNTASTVNLSGSDPETCQLTFAIVTGPTHGSLASITNNACVAGSPNTDSATVTYTPTAGYSGADSFTYTVNDGTATSTPATASLTVSPNTAPTANATSKTTPQDTPAAVSLSGSDPESCTLTFTIVTGPANGTLGSITDNACVAGVPNTDSATVTYTPASGYNGPDSFTYKVNDGNADSPPATASLTVTPPAANTIPTANPASKTTPYETAGTVNLGGSDPETCELTFAIVTSPTHGTLGSIANNACAAGSPNTDTATVTYTPAAGYSGGDSFTYTVNDGTDISGAATATLTVSANTTPTANATSKTTAQNTPATVNLSGSDPEKCQLTFAIVNTPAHGSLGAITDNACVAGAPNTDSATVTYTPDSGYSGPDSFTYTVNDGTVASAEATASLTVSGAGPTTLTFNPIADTHVNTSNVNGNYGTLTTIKVREGDGSTTNPNYHGYLKFSLSGVTGTVSTVKLRLFVTDASPNLESIYVVADSSWTETGITYNTAPSLDGLTAAGSSTAPTAGAYLEITLAPTTVSSSTTTLSLGIKSSGGDSAIFSSREDPTNKPQLAVTFQ